MSENFAELFEESLQTLDMVPGSTITGIVVGMDDDWVTVHAGLKSEGVIPVSQFKDDKGQIEIAIGDEVQVVLETVEDGFGETKLSREKAKRYEAWAALEKVHIDESIIEGHVSGKVKGGFTVDIGVIRAFLPGSLVDVRPMRDTSHIEGKTLEFKVIKLDAKRNNVVVSRRAVLEEANSAEREELFANLAEGQTVDGIVKNLTDYGAFVDLGGLDGLLHITDMSWKRIKHPSEIVAVGDEIKVTVLKFDRESSRVSLGLKQLGQDPWIAVRERYPVGAKAQAKITNLADYGCFAEIEEGIEGLVHVSEMDWTSKNIHPSKLVNLGDTVEVMVLDIDEGRRRISLGIKQCQENPWEAFANRYKAGDKISGTIKSITDFGLFIGVDGNIDGLVHLSDLAWDDSGDELIRNFKKGDELETEILLIDSERERISLGLKQLQEDPFVQYIVDGNEQGGATVTGVLKEVKEKIAVLEFSDGVQGTLKASEYNHARTDDLTRYLNVGDDLEVKVIGLDRKNKQVSVSVKALVAEGDVDTSMLKQPEEEISSPTTIGDLIKAKMESQS